MPQPIRTKTNGKKEYWSNHIINWQKGTLSQERYCAEAGISFSAFAYWRTRLRKEERDSEKAKIHKSQASFKQAVIKPHVGLLSTKSNDRINVTLPNKTIIEIPTNLEQKELITIFNALGGLT